VYKLIIAWCIMHGVLSYEEHLERACEDLCAKKGKHIDTLRMQEF